jgi:phage-related protein
MKTLLMAPIELAVNLALKLAEVEGVFGKIKLVVSSVWKLLKAHPFASIVAAIALVIDGFRRLWDESEAFRTYVGGVFAGLGEAFSSMFETLNRVFNNNILPLFKTLLNAFTDTEGGLNKLWDVFSKVVGWMAALMTGTFTTVVVNTFVWLVETIANIIAPIADILNGLIMFIDGIFSGDLGQAADGITKIVKAFFDAIVNIGRNSLNALIRIINQVALGIAGAFNALTESLNKIKIPDWVPKIGGKSLNWGLI